MYLTAQRRERLESVSACRDLRSMSAEKVDKCRRPITIAIFWLVLLVTGSALAQTKPSDFIDASSADKSRDLVPACIGDCNTE